MFSTWYSSFTTSSELITFSTKSKTKSQTLISIIMLAWSLQCSTNSSMDIKSLVRLNLAGFLMKFILPWHNIYRACLETSLRHWNSFWKESTEFRKPIKTHLKPWWMTLWNQKTKCTWNSCSTISCVKCMDLQNSTFISTGK